MLGSDAVRRIERMNAMIERERKEHEGKLPSCPRKSGEWGSHPNNTGLAGINQINGKFRASIFGPEYPKGMTPECWEIIKQQPIIKNKRYGKFGGVSSLCEEAMRIKCEWEKAMMSAIGEDGIGSVTKAIEQLKADKHALQQKLDAMAAENAALKSERAQMVEIGELIRTQDNRITDQPFFAVMTKREIVGSEDHDYDRICWVENQRGNYVEATETQHRRLEAIYQGKYEVREGWDRYAMKEIDVFVTGCFTEQGCKDYISRNAHNLNKPFIYAFGSYRNNEYQAVRKFIMDLPETPVTDTYLNSVRAEGIHFAANRMLAAWECGFINDTPEQVHDISGAVLSALEFLPNASPEEFKRDYADEVRASIAEQLRSGTHETTDKAG
ncbi:hypothetical protein GH714_044083 [Hevea brasiliensis]|uniref:Uncharacterized protein n=1 Tax=Hevea brasiliensis TaxID=3981 RepID=A0A6A6K1G1_HEVBR|nr:hypothetical protein GH714_044083 [Hevea brasiliensis]